MQTPDTFSFRHRAKTVGRRSGMVVSKVYRHNLQSLNQPLADMTSNLTFWKPGTTGPGSTLDRATEAEGNVVQSAPSYNPSIQAQRERLPIFKHSKYGRLLENTLLIYIISIGEKLLHCLEKYGVIIVVGQTGCGKTTREFIKYISQLSLIYLDCVSRTTSIFTGVWLGSLRKCNCMHSASTCRCHFCCQSSCIRSRDSSW